MANDPRIQDLLEAILESAATPADVCRQSPELLPEVQARLQRLRACDADLDLLFPAPPSFSSIASPRREYVAADLPDIPGYEVEEILGYGGMGVVYRARHLRLNRSVALKMLLGGAYLRPEHRDRFTREAEAIARLQHPNIVQVYDMGEQNGQPYFTMEFVEGGNLAEKLAGTPQPHRQAAVLLAILADAVQVAHESGIVHRDLKPSNVLLGADGTPKISDFGLARRVDDEANITRIGAALGTPSYMAPEQAEGRSIPACPAVDVYALGAILYELLTGRPPFKAESSAETIRQVISQEPVPPSQLNDKAPRDLETVCLQCLRKEPHLRYDSDAALAMDLRRFLSGEAIAARPDGPLSRLSRRIRRRPILSMVIATSVVYAVALLGGGLWLLFDRALIARRIEAERMATERAAAVDLQDTARWLQESSWPEARAALERAKARLGPDGTAELRSQVEQDIRDLDLVAKLDAIEIDIARGVVDFIYDRSDGLYETAYREAGIGQPQDDPDIVAERIELSNIKNALVSALDHWSGCTADPQRKSWVQAVARKSDPDSTGWRDRARDPAMLSDKAALAELIKTAPVEQSCVQLFLAIDKQARSFDMERVPFLQRVQEAHPGNFWVNLTLGNVLLNEKRRSEAIRYFQAAMAIRPELALSYTSLSEALIVAGRGEEAIAPLRRAAELDPNCIFIHDRLALQLSYLGKYDDAIDRLQAAVLVNPSSGSLHTSLAKYLEIRGRNDEALAHHQQAVAIEANGYTQSKLRNILARIGRGDEARSAWEKEIQARPTEHDARYGYAEFCLYLGREEEYRRARHELLSSFRQTADPFVAERTARACLLLPGTEEELRLSADLCKFALAAEGLIYRRMHPYFHFVQGLVEYREGEFARAISTMRGDAAGFLGPAPRLVLAMALHQHGEVNDARKTLAAAVLAYDWTMAKVSDQDDWIYHVLRREAEQLILPNAPAFLMGQYQPQDDYERLALIGISEFSNRTNAVAHLYADAFATVPDVVNSEAGSHRMCAVRAAMRAIRGHGEDSQNLSSAVQGHLRSQAFHWLRVELARWRDKLESAPETNGDQVFKELTAWFADLDLADVREREGLESLPTNEKDDWLALWAEADAIRARAMSE